MSDYYSEQSVPEVRHGFSYSPGRLRRAKAIRLSNNSPQAAGSPSVSAGHHKIPTVKPWGEGIPQVGHTSYSVAFSRDFGEAQLKRRMLKRLLVEQPHKIDGLMNRPKKKLASDSKAMSRLGELLANKGVKRNHKLSFLSPAQPLDFRAEDIRHCETPGPRYVTKLSKCNLLWLQEIDRSNLMKKFSSGEFVPGTDQLNLYGRRALKTRFEETRLWEAGRVQRSWSP